MSDKEKMKKAFQNLKAPEDTPERILEKMNQKENKPRLVARKILMESEAGTPVTIRF